MKKKGLKKVLHGACLAEGGRPKLSGQCPFGNITFQKGASLIEVLVFGDDSLSNDWCYGYLYVYEQNKIS